MRIQLKPLYAISIVVGIAACAAADSTAPSAPGSVSVSFATVANAAASASASLAPATITSGSDVLVISKVQIVLARMELQRVGATCASNDDGGDDDSGNDASCSELELAPTIVDLPVDGSVINALSVTIPAGSYSAFEAKISPVESKGSASRAFLAAHPEFAGATVRVEGTFNGKAFTYTGAPRAQLESVFNPPLDATSTATNVTINANLASWFRTSSGTLLDPATANAGGVNAGVVSNNIARSFQAFRDDDRDGHEGSGNGGHGRG